MGKMSETGRDAGILPRSGGPGRTGQSAAGFRFEIIRHHRLGATWQRPRPFILICRNALDLWCAGQRRQAVIR